MAYDMDGLASTEEQLYWRCVLDRKTCGSRTDTSCTRCRSNSRGWHQSQKRIADGVTHQGTRAIGENSVADGQVLPTK